MEKPPDMSRSSPSPPEGRRSPSPSRLRLRPLARSATFGDANTPLNRKRSSLFLDNASETRKSLRSSTDDLLLPRFSGGGQLDQDNEHSHWHSVPLGFALLPAVGGLLFQDGSAVVTDITLLALAAIFLNWSVRLPWDWYRSAQAVKPVERHDLSAFDTIAEENSEEAQESAISSHRDDTTLEPSESQCVQPHHRQNPSGKAARQELQAHELLALASCFLFPAVGAWLLHAIRGQLSRPSEGLVSNYNLTVFLLAAEVRPMSHLVKMIQARTLYLQRVVSAIPTDDESGQVADLIKRLEELEAHIADSVEQSSKSPMAAAAVDAGKTIAQAVSEARRSFQPEIGALNRAVRRYEKRTTISSLQTEARLQDLESRLKDVVVLAAAAQRTAEKQPQNSALILLNWICALVVLPMQGFGSLVRLPLRVAHWTTSFVRRFFAPDPSKMNRYVRTGNQIKARDKKLQVVS